MHSLMLVWQFGPAGRRKTGSEANSAGENDRRQREEVVAKLEQPLRVTDQ